MNPHFARRRRLSKMLPAAGCVAIAGPLFAQAPWPIRPLRLVVAYPPGGPLDVLARSLGEALGQVVVVENRGGAGGVIGSDYVAKAALDGYTLLFGSTPLTIQETLPPRLPYSIPKEFTRIPRMAEEPHALVVGNAVPANNVKEQIEYAKVQNGRLNYASPSAGGLNHLAAEILKLMGGFSATHVPCKRGAPAEIDLISGQVTFMFSAFSSVMALAKNKRLKVLGVSSHMRMATAPDVPAIAETLPGFEVVSCYGLVGLAGLPVAMTTRLNGEVNPILGSADMRKRFATMGLEATPGARSILRVHPAERRHLGARHQGRQREVRMTAEQST